MSTAVATKTAPTADVMPRKLPEIDPAMVRLDQSGHVRNSYVVRLPQGMIADDLKERGIWRRVQNARTSFKQHDQVFFIAHDQAWVAEAVVSEADATGVAVAGVRIIQTPQRARILFRDDKYGIVWNGAGYHVERLIDGHKMTSTVANAALAEKDLRNLYPLPMNGSQMGR